MSVRFYITSVLREVRLNMMVERPVVATVGERNIEGTSLKQSSISN